MKKIKILLVLPLLLLFLTGCKPGKKMKYEGKDLIITFSTNYSVDYKITTDSNFFRTAREEAMLVGEKFKIGIEITSVQTNEEYDGNFVKFMEKYKNKEDFKTVKYDNRNGFMIYTKPYARYEIYLPVDDKYIVRFNIYAYTNNKKSTTNVLKSSEVKQILKYLEIKEK